MPPSGDASAVELPAAAPAANPFGVGSVAIIAFFALGASYKAAVHGDFSALIVVGASITLPLSLAILP